MADVEDDPKMRKLIDAVEDENEAGVKRMLQRGVDVNGSLKGGYSPLHAAARFNSKDMIKFLIANGAEVDLVNSDKKKETPLHTACHQGQLSAVKTLVRSGASLNARTKQNRTPVDVAHIRGHEDVVDYLEGKGLRDAKAAKKKLKAAKKKNKKKKSKSGVTGITGILLPIMFLLFLILIINLIGS